MITLEQTLHYLVRNHISGLLVMFLVLISSIPASAGDYLSIKFSKKNQIHTGMHWIQHRSELILGTSSARTELLGDKNRTSEVRELSSFNSTEYPYSTVGKLFFTRENGEIATCTAAFAGGSDLIITAAHCVMGSSGDWNSHFLFIRSYGTDQKDVYAIQCLAVPGEWGILTDNNVYNYDYAFLRTNRQSKFGSLGLTTGKPPEELMLVGYSDDFSQGRKLQRLNVPIWASENGRIGLLNNKFGSGSSGTPWLGLSTVYSVTSHFQNNEKDIMWGPKLTDSTMHLITYTLNGCEN